MVVSSGKASTLIYRMVCMGEVKPNQSVLGKNQTDIWSMGAGYTFEIQQKV